MASITYRAGYKYQLAKTYVVQTPIRPEEDIETYFIGLSKDGLLTIRRGYAWDGASGIPDRKSNMRAALLHDAGYQLLRGGLVPQSQRENWDDEYERIVIEDGGWRWLAKVDRLGLQYLPAAKRAASMALKKPILTAP